MTISIKYDRDYDDYSILRKPAQLKLLLPYYPDCTSNLKSGNNIYVGAMPRKKALKHSYIQMNPKSMYVFMVLDIDRPFAPGELSYDCNLPWPYFVVYNRKNGHAHVIYVLRKPVCTTDLGSYSALKYLKAIVNAYKEIAEADGMYAEHLAKNPWSKKWYVIQTGQEVYDLAGLVTPPVIDILERKPTKKPREDQSGLGRNCYIFEKARIWAYRAIREYWRNSEEWYPAVKTQCEILNREALNEGYSHCLGQSEVNQIAKSISRWVWRHITPEGFSMYQRNLVKRRWSKESRKEGGVTMLKAGFSVDEISDMLNVTSRTVYLWRGELPEMRHETVSEIMPWLDLGISRPTWYRLKKTGKL